MGSDLTVVNAARVSFSKESKWLALKTPENGQPEGLLNEGDKKLIKYLAKHNYWSGTLSAFARVCNLRCKDDTQAETREISWLIDDLAKNLFPTSWKALRYE